MVVGYFSLSAMYIHSKPVITDYSAEDKHLA